MKFGSIIMNDIATSQNQKHYYYFLFTSGVRIDHAHHASRAKAALEETLAFDKAVQKALDLTSADDTLIVVTADHSHVFTFGAEAPARGSGNSILGNYWRMSMKERARERVLACVCGGGGGGGGEGVCRCL